MPWVLRKPRACLQVRGGGLPHAQGPGLQGRGEKQVPVPGASALWLPDSPPPGHRAGPGKAPRGAGSHSKEKLKFPPCPSVLLKFSPGTWYPLGVGWVGCSWL